MNISDIAIRRPVFTTMVTLGLVSLGWLGYNRLDTDLYPDVTMPLISVRIAVASRSPGLGGSAAVDASMASSLRKRRALAEDGCCRGQCSCRSATSPSSRNARPMRRIGRDRKSVV